MSDVTVVDDGPEKLAADFSSLEIQRQAGPAPGTPEETRRSKVPAHHRSHDPQTNQKRSDPFMFGSRYLEDGDDVFEFNAWDHVETDAAYEVYAQQQYEMQRQSPVSDWDKQRFNADPAKWWNQFYKNNTANFFKDRKWLQQEFPILADMTKADAGPVTLLEIGAGAGNTAFPVLAQNQNPHLRLHACDFSKQAVKVMREHEAYDTRHMQADVWDVAGDTLPPDLGEASVDVAIMVFVFSALAPSQWARAVDNVHRVLKPGGLVCFRDYGRGDLAQVRFRKGRYLEENFYIRGDGTRVYFFDTDQLAALWSGEKVAAPVQQAGRTREEKDKTPAEISESADPETRPPVDGPQASPNPNRSRPQFVVENMGVDRRLLVNRARKLKMHRCWLQGRFRKA